MLSQIQEEWRLDILCRVPQPAPVAQAMLEALWHTHLAPVADDEGELNRRYVAEVVKPRLRCQPSPVAERREQSNLSKPEVQVTRSPTARHMSKRARSTLVAIGGRSGSLDPARPGFGDQKG